MYIHVYIYNYIYIYIYNIYVHTHSLSERSTYMARKGTLKLLLSHYYLISRPHPVGFL